MKVVTGDPRGEEGFVDMAAGATSVYPPSQLVLLFFQLPCIPWSSQNNVHDVPYFSECKSQFYMLKILQCDLHILHKRESGRHSHFALAYDTTYMYIQWNLTNSEVIGIVEGGVLISGIVLYTELASHQYDP